MSSGSNQHHSPSGGPTRGRSATPLPQIMVDTAEANSLGFVGSGSGSTGLARGSSFPTTPTPTLGGAAVRHSQSAGTPVVTFTPSLNSTGAISPASPGAFPSEAPGYPAARPLDAETRCRQDFQELREELGAMVEGLPAPSADIWNSALEQLASLEGLQIFLTGLDAPPRSFSSAEAVWQYHLRETLHDVVTADPSGEFILVFLVTRTTTILRRVWAEVVAPYLQLHSQLTNRRPQVSLEIPSPNLRLGGFPRSELAIPRQATAVTSRPVSPSSLTTDFSSRGATASTLHFYSQANRGIGSLNLPLSSNASGRTSNSADLPIYQDPAVPLRVSLDSLESGVASIDEELQGLQNADQSEEVHGRVGYLKRLRKRMMAAMSTLARGGSLSRSGSPSPTATPRGDASRGRGPFTPAPPPATATAPAPASQEAAAHPQPASDPPSPFPWDVKPHTRHPRGAKAIIGVSPQDGKYYLEAIAAARRSQTTEASVAPPSPTHRGDDPTRRPPVVGRIPTPSVVIPPFATSVDADIVHLLRLAGTDDEVVDRSKWAGLYDRVIGACMFSSVGHSDPSAPSTSTSTAHLRLSLACINPYHQELGLPCTLHVDIPLNMDLSALLQQLEILQGTRVSQLMTIVAQAFLGHQQAMNSSDTLVPGPSTSTNTTTTSAQAHSTNVAEGGSSTGTATGSGPEATSAAPGPKAEGKGKGRREADFEEE